MVQKKRKPDGESVRRLSIEQAKQLARADIEKRTGIHIDDIKHQHSTDNVKHKSIDDKYTRMEELNKKLSDSNTELNENYKKLDQLHSQLKLDKDRLKKEFETFKGDITPKLAVYEVKSKQCDTNIDNIQSKLREKISKFNS